MSRVRELEQEITKKKVFDSDVFLSTNAFSRIL
jgi:hypothetical protein